MSETIWKFPLRVAGEQEIELPELAKLLTIQMQDGQPCLWAIVDPRQPKSKRTIRIHGTGHIIEPFKGTGRYISTFQMQGGALVFHAFEA